MATTAAASGSTRKDNKKLSLGKRMLRGWQLYIMFLIPLIYLLLFKYGPMFGAQIAFKDYIVTKGIMGSPWVGFKHFERFFTSYEFTRIIGNTLIISVYGLLAGFPFPILLALMLNYMQNQRFKKTVQLVTYAPYFISTVVMVSMILQFLAPRTGIINNLLGLFGIQSTNFMGEAAYFRHIYVWSGVWQTAGYNAVIYLAALAGIDPSLHEAAIVDGASKLQRMWHIDLPGIAPTAVIMLILNTGQILNTGFEKIYLMQNSLNKNVSEVIDTYVYKIGLASAAVNFSYPTAIGLFKSVVGLILIVTVNSIAKKLGGQTLW